jgi:surfactin synthase thioesterase subunit
MRLRARPDAKIRLICFPSAGAGASVYGRWSEHLPHEIEAWAVQLPGRETRRLETSLTDLQAIADDCARLAQPLLDRPYALFGHSMGALAAFEVARRLTAGGCEPLALFVSGRAAPHISRGYEGIEQLPDDEFITRMDTMFGGVPDLLKTDAEFRELYLPPLRADVAAVARYTPSDRSPCSFPIHVLGGSEDRSVTRAALEAWESYAASEFRVHVFPGDHFYVYSTREPVIALVSSALARAQPRASRTSADVGVEHE